MSDFVVVIGSAEIDYGIIDTSHIGVVEILATEGIAMVDSPLSAYKKGTKTFIEGEGNLDTFSKYKITNKFFTEGLALYDSLPSKLKKVSKQFLDFLGISDGVEEIIIKVTPNNSRFDSPAINVTNQSR